MPLFESLEDFYVEIDKWQLDDQVTKVEMVRNCRARLARIISELLAAPHVGTAFAHPSDTLVLAPGSQLESNRLEFMSDACTPQEKNPVAAS